MNTDDDDYGAYESLAAAIGGEERWAFGTGFDDPLAGIDATVPPGVEADALARQCLAMGDDSLVMSQRLALWCTHAPELEDEVAIANIALDLLGQARMLLTRAAQVDPSVRPAAAPEHIPAEDALAYFRSPAEFTCVPLAAFDCGHDFGRLVAYLCVSTAYRLEVLDAAASSPDPVLAAIAAKGRIEAAYHWEYAAGWLRRLGDGTDESHRRMQQALDTIWPYLPDIAAPDLQVAIAAATLRKPASRPAAATDDELAALLADMQSLARAIPAATW